GGTAIIRSSLFQRQGFGHGPQLLGEIVHTFLKSGTLQKSRIERVNHFVIKQRHRTVLTQQMEIEESADETSFISQLFFSRFRQRGFFIILQERIATVKRLVGFLPSSLEIRETGICPSLAEIALGI